MQTKGLKYKLTKENNSQQAVHLQDSVILRLLASITLDFTNKWGITCVNLGEEIISATAIRQRLLSQPGQLEKKRSKPEGGTPAALET